jgi:hypothetical protein
MHLVPREQSGHVAATRKDGLHDIVELGGAGIMPKAMPMRVNGSDVNAACDARVDRISRIFTRGRAPASTRRRRDD